MGRYSLSKTASARQSVCLAILKQHAKKALSGDHRAAIWLFQLADDDPTLAISEKTKAELQAEEARKLDLFYSAVNILVDLGVPLPQITSGQPMNNSIDTESISDHAENDAIEITSTPLEDAPSSAGSLPA